MGIAALYAYGADSSVLHDRELTGEVYGYDPDGDAFWIASVDGIPVGTHNEVSLSSGARVLVLDNVRFTYIPPSRFVGTDSFTYTVTDGLAESPVATVRIDITNTAPIARDMTIHVPDTMPVTLSLICDEPGLECEGAYDPDGDPLHLEIVAGPYQGEIIELGRYLIYSPNPSSSSGESDWFYYRVWDGIAASEIKRVELVRDQTIAHAPAGGPTVKITAYRPIHKIFEQEEVQADQGGNVRVGVRWNNDNDDDDRTSDGVVNNDRWDKEVANENDLVKVVLDFKSGDENRQPPAGVLYRLRADNDNIRVWLGGPDKRNTYTAVLGPIVTGIGQFNGVQLEASLAYPVGADAGKMTIWVEWMTAPDLAAGGNKTVLTFEALVGGNVISASSIELYAYQGMVFVFGGKTQEPQKWGEHGIFVLGHKLYKLGYDVYLFRHGDSAGALREASMGIGRRQGAMGSRGVTKVALIGYSSGGNRVYHFAELLKMETGPNPGKLYPNERDFSAYVDAIMYSVEGSNRPETRRPETPFHINYYQRNEPSYLLGDATYVPQEEPRRGGYTTVNNNVSHLTVPTEAGGTRTIGHYDIDDHEQVHQGIIEALEHRGWK